MRPAPAPQQTSAMQPLTAHAYLKALKAHGIDYLFVNSGTDFPSIIESFARAGPGSAELPRPLVVPHEHVAVGMAHGYYAGHRPAAGGDVARQRRHRERHLRADQRRARQRADPVHGRPHAAHRGRAARRAHRATSTGRRRCSTRPAWCARASNGTTSCARRSRPDDVVARALEVAMTPPRGPVYLSLPREVLAAPAAEPDRPPRRWTAPAPAAPDPQAVETLADWIARRAHAAHRHRRRSGAIRRRSRRWPRSPSGSRSRWCRWRRAIMCLPASHPMHLRLCSRGRHRGGATSSSCSTPTCRGSRADRLKAGARVAHLGDDPTFARYPMRSYPNDLAIPADPVLTLRRSMPRSQAASRPTTSA